MKKTLFVLFSCLVLTGCAPAVGGAHSEASPVQIVTPSSDGVEIVLDTTRIEYAPEWIGVMFNPAFVEQTSATIVDSWPRNGDTVRALCYVSGLEYMNPVDGLMTVKWYRVVIPEDTIEPSTASAVERRDGVAVGYIEAFWLEKAGDVTSLALIECSVP